MAVALLLPGTASAGDLYEEVNRILAEYHVEVRAKQPARISAANRAEWEKFLEQLRKKTAGRIEALAIAHSPTGEGEAKDITPACEALMMPPLVPDGAEACALALRLLKLDPRNAGCWSYVELLLDHVRFEHQNDEPPWSELRRWARAARTDSGVEDEAARALDVLNARLALETGNKKEARATAQRVLDAGAGSEALLKAARAVKSLASLLRPGTDAPGFRIASLTKQKKEYALRELRGRALLLYFRPVDDDDFALEAIIEQCLVRLSRSQIVALTIAPGNDADAIAALRRDAQDAPWPVAEPGEVAGQIAAAYGVEGICALYLIGPDGRVLKSGDWSTGTSPDDVVRMVKESVGPPLDETLRAIAAGATHEEFRRFWHSLVRHGRTRFDAATWRLAKSLGPRAHDALLLANADAAGPPRVRIEQPVSLAGAWWLRARRDDDSAWNEQAGKALANPRGDACLAVLHRIYELGLRGEPVRPALEQVAVRASRWETVSMALRCLRYHDTTASPRVLGKRQRHKLWQVRLALAEALQAYRHKDAVDLLIAMLGDKRTRVRERAAKSLTRLTAEPFGVSQKRWVRWRKEQGASIRFPPREISRKSPFRKKGHKYAHRGYYGLQVASNHLIFVLDKSDSMFYGLFDGVVEEMQAHLSSAGPTTKFNVVEFAEKPTIWKPKLVPANAANLRSAVQFLHRAKPYGPTNVIDALRLAMRTPELDSIVLLSDGLPNRGDPGEPGGILRAVESENRDKRIAIHTVLLIRGRAFKHDDPKGKDVPPLDRQEKDRRKRLRELAPTLPLGKFLKELADSNDGTFGVGFADAWLPPPGASTRPSTDK